MKIENSFYFKRKVARIALLRLLLEVEKPFIYMLGQLTKLLKYI